MLGDVWKGLTDIGGGVKDIGAGGLGFVLDSGKAAGELFQGDVGEAAEILYGSVLDDLMGKSIQGAFGPEGIGGTLIGALPEQVRGPSRAVITPTLDAWQWVIDEVVDRPLGTAFTVLNAATGTGASALLDWDTYKQAWEVNDARTFGQAFAAFQMTYRDDYFDPFDEEEFNALRQDPLFNLISGTADFMQEFIDPVNYFTAGAAGAIKGTKAVSIGGRVVGRTGAAQTIGSGTRVYEIGRSSRSPANRAGYDPVQGIAANPDAARQAWGQPGSSNHGGLVEQWQRQSVYQFLETNQWKELNGGIGRDGQAVVGVLDDVKYAGATDMAISTRFEAVREAFPKMPAEAALAVAEGQTATARNLMMRAVAGDVSAVAEARQLAQNLLPYLNDTNFMPKVIEHETILNRLADDALKAPDRRMAATERARLEARKDELLPEVIDFNTAVADIPFEAMFDLNVALQSAQNRGVLGGYGQFDLNDNFNVSFQTVEDTALTVMALNKMLSRTDPLLASTEKFLPVMDELPYASPLQRLLQRNRDYARNSITGSHVDERLIPRVIGAGSRRIKFFTGKLAQTTMDTRDPNAYEQFERMLEQASQVTLPSGKGQPKVALIERNEIGRILGRFQQELERGLVDPGAYDRALDIFDQVDDMLVKRFDQAAADVGLSNSTVGNLEEQLRKARGVRDEQLSEQALSILPDSTAHIIRDGGEVIVMQYDKMMSPSQIRTTRVLHRWDLVTAELKKIKRHDRLPDFVSTPLEATQAGYQKLRRGADHSMNVWKPIVLLTPKWPMRVSLDEQLRIAASLGGLEGLSMLIKNMPNLSRTYAAKALTRKNPQALGNAQDLNHINKKIDEKLGRKFGEDATIVDRLEAVQKEVKNPDKWLQGVYRDLINDAMAQNKMRRARNSALKGTGVGLVVNPFVGVGYAAISHYSRRRRMLQLAEINAKRTIAEALQKEGRSLMAETLEFSDNLSAGMRATLVDEAANMIRKGAVLLDDIEKAAQAQKATNLLDQADKMMIDSGLPHLSVSGYRLTSAYGDERRVIEQTRRQVSSKNSVEATTRSLHSNASRELQDFSQGFKQNRYGEGSPQDFKEQFDRTMDIFTPGDSKEFREFYDIVWSNEALSVREAKLAAELKRNEALRRRMGILPDDDLPLEAAALVQNYDNLLPAGYADGLFDGLRQDVANGKQLSWDDVEAELRKLDDKAPMENLVRDVKRRHSGFGVTLSPDKAPRGRNLGELIQDKLEPAFDMLGTQVTDNIARNPYFQAVYEREVNRLMAKQIDAAGNAIVNQRAIMGIQKQAQKSAMAETRRLLYDLTEQTKFGEAVSNLMPFYNAWAEVFSRWAGLAIENPYFVANTYRLYQKPWNAEALGISEVTVEFDGEETDYLMFQWPTAAPTGENDVDSIWSLMPTEVQELLTPKVVRDMGGEIKLSKEGLATMLQSTTPGFGPLVTIPIREATLRNPELVEITDFMFPFGHPEEGFVGRLTAAQLPSYAQSIRDEVLGSPRQERTVQAMFIDYAIERELAGDPIDPTDLADVNEAIGVANERARTFNIFRIGVGLFSPTSTTVASPYDEMAREARRLQQEYGTMEGNARFLSEYGEEFFTLTTRLTELNDGVFASVVNEMEYERLQDLAQAHPEIGAYISGSVGPMSEKAVFSQAMYRKQQQEQVSPSDPTPRRSRKSLLDTLADPQIELGWMKYNQLQDAIRIEQSRREDVGLPSALNHPTMARLKAFQDREMAALAQEYPAWAQELNNFGESAAKQKRVIDGFVAVAEDERMRIRPSYSHVLDYLALRTAVQDELVRREAQGGSLNLEAGSNTDLLLFFAEEREVLADRPEFSQIFDRFFSRDMILPGSFIEEDARVRSLF